MAEGEMRLPRFRAGKQGRKILGKKKQLGAYEAPL
jgi:hypothetical protein